MSRAHVRTIRSTTIDRTARRIHDYRVAYPAKPNRLSVICRDHAENELETKQSCCTSTILRLLKTICNDVRRLKSLRRCALVVAATQGRREKGGYWDFFASGPKLLVLFYFIVKTP